MQKAAIPALLLFILFSSSLALGREPLYKEATPQEAQTLVQKGADKALVVDVRTPAEFEQGHIPGARNIDFFGPRFEKEISSLPRDIPVLVYCRSGKRSAGAAEAMTEQGMANIIHMSQGMEAWEAAGLPVEKQTQPPR